MGKGRTSMVQQVAHQIDIFEALEAAEPITAPLSFTVEPYSREEFEKADKRWRHEHGSMGARPQSHMWSSWDYQYGNNRTMHGGHQSYVMSADTRCDHHREKCSCVGDLLYRVYCEGCGNVSAIHDNENAAVEDHLDQCWPGWRDLPTVTATAKDSGGHRFKLPEGYPEAFMADGAPVRTLRSAGATRHVPGRSPFGGYDTGHTA